MRLCLQLEQLLGLEVGLHYLLALPELLVHPHQPVGTPLLLQLPQLIRQDHGIIVVEFLQQPLQEQFI